MQGTQWGQVKGEVYAHARVVSTWCKISIGSQQDNSAKQTEAAIIITKQTWAAISKTVVNIDQAVGSNSAMTVRLEDLQSTVDTLMANAL